MARRARPTHSADKRSITSLKSMRRGRAGKLIYCFLPLLWPWRTTPGCRQYAVNNENLQQHKNTVSKQCLKYSAVTMTTFNGHSCF